MQGYSPDRMQGDAAAAATANRPGLSLHSHQPEGDQDANIYRLTGEPSCKEDCDWALPYLALGLDAFEGDAARAANMRQAAARTVQRFHPQHTALLGVSGLVGGRSDG